LRVRLGEMASTECPAGPVRRVNGDSPAAEALPETHQRASQALQALTVTEVLPALTECRASMGFQD